MHASHSYQRVADGDGDDSTENNEHGGSRPSGPAKDTSYSTRDLEQMSWVRRPSVFWLLPSFLLFNLAMGATAMPRMNVLISLLCRDLMKDMPSSNITTSLQPTPRHGGVSMNMGDTPANHTSSVVIIGDYNPQCSIPEVESATAMLNLWGNLIGGIIGAIAAPFWGKMSDHYGRVKSLAASGTVILASEVVTVLLASLPNILSLNWVYLAFVLEGLSGSFILIMALASSYAADCTQAKDRNVALGWFHGSMFFGMAVGPALGGYIGVSDGKSRPLVIFYTGLAMRAFAILFLALVPESLDLASAIHDKPALDRLKRYLLHSSRGPWKDRAKRINPLHLLRVLGPTPTRSKTTSRNLLALATMNTVMFGAMMGAMNIMMLYSEFRFGWGNKETGIFLSTVNIFRTIATIIVLPLVIKFARRFSSTSAHHSAKAMRISHSDSDSPGAAISGIDFLDVLLLRLSLASDLIGYIGYALSPTGLVFTLSGAIAALGAIGLATSEAAMTKLLPPSLTGELLGALGFLQALARIIAPTVASLVYSWTVEEVPQLTFWGIAIMFACAGVATVFVKTGGGDGGVGMDMELEGRGDEAIPLRTTKIDE